MNCPENNPAPIDKLPTATSKSTLATEYFKKANNAWRAHRFDEALTLFEKAVASDPDNPIGHVNLARAYGMNFQYDRSAHLTKEISKRFSDLPQVMYMLGESDLRYNHLSSAEGYFRSAINLGIDAKHEVRAYVMIAEIRERLHRVDDAFDAADKALTKWPDHPKALLIKAKILARLGKQEDSNHIFQRLAGGKSVSPNVKAEAWYQLGRWQDKQGDYGQAFASCLKAKEAYQGKLSSFRKKADATRRHHRLLLEVMNKETLKKWTASAGELQPFSNRGIAWQIGHPRSGTTLLGQVLDGHPDLFTADEVQVFGQSTFPRLANAIGSTPDDRTALSILSRATPEQLNHQRKLFFRQVEGAMEQEIGERFLLNKNPDLTSLTPAVCRVFPETKIICALRDPRDVIISCFMQALPANPVSIEYFSIESTARAYAMNMNLWIKLRKFIEAPWLEVRYEDVVQDLSGQAEKALSFLGLAWDPQVLDFNTFAKDKHVHSPTYQAVTKPIYSTSVGRWKNYEKHLSPVLDLLYPYLEVFGYDV